MTNVTDRTDVLAEIFERLAVDLRSGDATLYGYDVSTEPRHRERGGVSFSEGWLSFDLVSFDDE